MLDKLVFYNHYGAGDIFESREFVKDYMKQLPAKEYYYAHNKCPGIIADIPELRFIHLDGGMDSRSRFSKMENSLYINTWIGRTGKYVLPGAGCTVEKLFGMHNEYLQSIAGKKLLKTMYEYIPSIDYSYYYVEDVNKFLESNKNRKVLIDNGLVMSQQAYNFDFTPIIIRLSKEFPDITFIITHDIVVRLDNVVTAYRVIRKDDFDLNEIAYLSQFCDTLIGRCSGPHTFCQNLDNWLDKDKVLLSFTYTEYGASFVLNTKHVYMKKYWSPEIGVDEVVDVCRRRINREQ